MTKTFWYSHFSGTKENLVAFANAIEVADAEKKLGNNLEALLTHGFTKPTAEWNEFLAPLLLKFNIKHQLLSFEV